jgi:glycosyltransferase involved in cell wall biosynthesis
MLTTFTGTSNSLEMNSKKNIWFISQYAGGPGIGMQYRQFLFCSNLINKGHNASVISSTFSHLFNQFPIQGGQSLDNVYYHFIKTPKYKKSISIGRFWNMLVFAIKVYFLNDEKLGKPDLIVVSSPSMLPIIAALKWKKKYNCKVFFEVRDIWPLTLQELGNLSSFHPLVMFMRYFEKLAYRKSDLVLSLLPNAQEHFISSGMHLNNFRYLPNGVETTEIENTSASSLFPDIPKDDFIVGYGGSIGKANALHYLIHAAEQLKEKKNIHFVIIGKGDELIHLQEISKGLSNVHIFPPLEKRLFIAALKQFDLCYIGLEREPLFRFGVSPNKLFDYMMAKRPVLFAIDSGNQPVKEASCGWSVAAGDIPAIAQSILEASETDVLQLEEMGNNGYHYVIKNHSYDVLCENIIKWIDE